MMQKPSALYLMRLIDADSIEGDQSLSAQVERQSARIAICRNSKLDLADWREEDVMDRWEEGIYGVSLTRRTDDETVQS